MRFRGLLSVVAAAGALTFAAVGCGDDDDSGSTQPAPPPAQTSTAGSDTAAAPPAPPAGEPVSGTIAGAGASSQAAAQDAWIAGFQQVNSGATISYDPIGSGGGREQFVAGGTDFGGTDAHLADEELTAAQERCGGPDHLIEAPAYVSPIAIIYNLPDLADLKLSPATLAGIFKQEITNWNDEAIAADNPGVELPDTRIVPVNRSDESGTTENFQEYLAAVAPDVWDFEVSGDWPVEGGEAAQGTSGVVDAVRAGEGTIGYADASQAGELGKAQIKVGESFVGPTPEAAAAILDASQPTDDPGQYVFTFDLARDTTASGTYPIVLVSYLMACTRYDDASKAAVVQAYLRYIVSEEGQAASASAAGSAPLTATLRETITPAIDAIGG